MSQNTNLDNQTTISKYLREIVYGGTDGIVTTFAIAAGFTGASISNSHEIAYGAVIIFGLANLFADATSMGVGNFLSNRAAKAAEKANGENNNKSTKEPKAIFTALATFLSFVAFGAIPLIPYFLNTSTEDINTSFMSSIIATLFALILLGIVRWKATNDKMLQAIAEIVILGGISAVVAFLVGRWVG